MVILLAKMAEKKEQHLHMMEYGRIGRRIFLFRISRGSWTLSHSLDYKIIRKIHILAIFF
jgi:hypothetical protein